MSIPSHARSNFQTLLRAAGDGTSGNQASMTLVSLGSHLADPAS